MKKFFAIFISLIMIYTCVAINAYAANNEKTIVTKIELTIDTNCAGQTVSEGNFISVLSDGIEKVSNINASYVDIPANTPPVDSTFDNGTSYNLYFVLYLAEGYSLGYDEPLLADGLWVNGQKYGDNSNNNIYYEISNGHSPEMVIVHYKNFTVTSPEPEPSFSDNLSQTFESFFLTIAEFFSKTFIQPIVDFFIMISK